MNTNKESIYRVKTIKITYKVNQKVSSPIKVAGEAYVLLCEIYKNLDVDQEHFCVLTLSGSNEITGYKIISSGGQCETRVDQKIVFRNCLLLGAVNIIIAHNHPSGTTEPSENDKRLTHIIKNGADILGIRLLDHIIIGKDHKYYSFAENKLL